MKLHKSNTELVNVHSPDKCAGTYCPIHNPSNHHMKDWPQHWRADRRIIERICPHGVGHPDPDDPAAAGIHSIHGCDGCCNPNNKQKYCQHEKVVPTKSRYGPEMVMKGKCPDCGIILLELD